MNVAPGCWFATWLPAGVLSKIAPKWANADASWFEKQVALPYVLPSITPGFGKIACRKTMFLRRMDNPMSSHMEATAC